MNFHNFVLLSIASTNDFINNYKQNSLTTGIINNDIMHYIILINNMLFKKIETKR